MIELAQTCDPPLRRHDLLHISPGAWASTLVQSPTSAALPWVTSWADRGWPVIVRRRGEAEDPGLVPVGLPLPPAAGKQRIALLLPPQDILRRRSPSSLLAASAVADREWRATIASLVALGLRSGVEPRAFGSILWQHQTGLTYLSAQSDLDILWPVPERLDVLSLVSNIAEIQRHAPVRIDGEIIFPDGSAINWRELWSAYEASGPATVLAKTMEGVKLLKLKFAARRRVTRMSPAPELATRSDRSASRPKRGYVEELIAEQAVVALLRELAAWPKPGLVSRHDSGSHTDMDAALLRTSAEALRPFFAELAWAGQDKATMARLRAIGLRAEAAMLAATGGINTHRGAVFGLGLLCAAAGEVARMSDERAVIAPVSLGEIVARRWGGEIERGPIPLFSHGAKALRRYGAGGARAEAAGGFRSVYEVGWPALRKGRSLQPEDRDAPLVQACFALIAAVGDTNLLHRGGPEGLRYAVHAASAFLAQGGVGTPDWRARAAAVHAAFVARRLSPGGSADLLAMTLFIDALEGTSRPPTRDPLLDFLTPIRAESTSTSGC